MSIKLLKKSFENTLVLEQFPYPHTDSAIGVWETKSLGICHNPNCIRKATIEINDIPYCPKHFNVEEMV